MNNKLTHKNTLGACYLGYITQAIVVNISPIFFVIFKDRYGLDNSQIGTIVFVLFVTQLMIDVASAWFVDLLGFRGCAVTANLAAATGLFLLGVLPSVMPSYPAIMISIVISAVGAGIIEVIISPIVDLLPADSKSSAMSLLHSFYCWGQVAVVTVSTLLLAVIGNDHWYIIPIMWFVIPVADAVLFSMVPLPEPVNEAEGNTVKSIYGTGHFALAAFIMFSAAMAELSMSQWASYFAERGLGINKVAGDLLGPCMFGVFMAIGRTVYGIYGTKWNLSKVLTGCALICSAGYLLTVFSPIPFLSLMGCGISGLGVSLMWPGTLSLTSAKFPNGGTRLFAILAMFGDIGCSVGPWLTGVVSDYSSHMTFLSALSNNTGIGMDQLAIKSGLLLISLFPIATVFVIRVFGKENK